MQADLALQFKYNNAIYNLYFLNGMLTQATPPFLNPAIPAPPALKVDFLRDTALKNRFEGSFRVITTSSVGRVLLYRLLIEIRRQQNVGVNNGTMANDANGLDTDVSRDFNRCITIRCGNFCFFPGILANSFIDFT